MTPERPEPDLVPFEIVREETERRAVGTRPRWLIVALAAAGALIVVGTLIVGTFLAILALVVALPLLAFRWAMSWLPRS